MKIAYSNGKFRILYSDSERNYDHQVKRVDHCFYVEVDGVYRYLEDDPIKMLEFILLNTVYTNERERIKEKIRKSLHL